jgi:hypothetical protein
MNSDCTGLLQFQLQTGAVGHGEYFFLSFDNVTTAATGTSSSTSRDTAAASTITTANSITDRSSSSSSSTLKLLTAEVTRRTAPLQPLEHQQPLSLGIAVAAAAAEMRAQTGFSTDVLRCEQYWHPGSEHAPFPYPPPQQNLTSCGYVAFCSLYTDIALSISMPCAQRHTCAALVSHCAVASQAFKHSTAMAAAVHCSPPAFAHCLRYVTLMCSVICITQVWLLCCSVWRLQWRSSPHCGTSNLCTEWLQLRSCRQCLRLCCAAEYCTAALEAQTSTPAAATGSGAVMPRCTVCCDEGVRAISQKLSVYGCA